MVKQPALPLLRFLSRGQGEGRGSAGCFIANGRIYLDRYIVCRYNMYIGSRYNGRRYVGQRYTRIS